jgi:hypothetical protein
MSDDFIKSLLIPPEELIHKDGRQKKAGDRSKGNGFEFFQFPVGVMTRIGKASNGAGVLGVLLALYELWFTRLNYNPVRLTSRSLRKYGVSRYQKRRALRALEKSGQILIDRSHGKNPLVTLKWLPLKEEPDR